MEWNGLEFLKNDWEQKKTIGNETGTGARGARRSRRGGRLKGHKNRFFAILATLQPGRRLSAKKQGGGERHEEEDGLQGEAGEEGTDEAAGAAPAVGKGASGAAGPGTEEVPQRGDAFVEFGVQGL